MFYLHNQNMFLSYFEILNKYILVKQFDFDGKVKNIFLAIKLARILNLFTNKVCLFVFLCYYFCFVFVFVCLFGFFFLVCCFIFVFMQNYCVTQITRKITCQSKNQTWDLISPGQIVQTQEYPTMVQR